MRNYIHAQNLDGETIVVDAGTGIVSALGTIHTMNTTLNFSVDGANPSTVVANEPNGVYKDSDGNTILVIDGEYTILERKKLYINGGKYSWDKQVFFDDENIPFDTYKQVRCASFNNNTVVIDKDCTVKIEFSVMCSTVISDGTKGDDILVNLFINGVKEGIPSWVGEDQGIVSKWHRKAGNSVTLTYDVKVGDELYFRPSMSIRSTITGPVSGVFNFVIEEI